MATDREKAIDLIQKLLMRTRDNGATQSEAEAAAAEVQRLLTKFNLSMAEAERSSDDLIEEQLEADPRDRVARVVGAIVCEFYFVMIFNRGRNVFLFGEPRNVEVASYVYSFLHRTCTDLCVAELGRYIDREGLRCFSDVERIIDPYCKGLAIGLHARLDRERKKLTPGERNALMIINQDLRDEIMRRYPTLEEGESLRFNPLDPATIKGMMDGERIEIREGIGGQAKRPERLAIAEGGRP